MTYAKGKKGKSQKDVRLYLDTVFGQTVLNVYEDGKLTHQFEPDQEFLGDLAGLYNQTNTVGPRIRPLPTKPGTVG